jgi:hypothetical protein
MWMTFCEFATVHADGTLTILRGSLCEWKLRAYPATLNIWAAAQVPTGSLKIGQHPLTLSIVSEAQEEIWSFTALAQIVKETSPVNLALPVLASLPSPGRYRAILQIASLRAEWGFEMARQQDGSAPS